MYWDGFVECVSLPSSLLRTSPLLPFCNDVDSFFSFGRLALEYGLHVTFKEDFQRIFVEERNDPQFSDLLTRMKVVDRQGETEMTMDQWEAASESVF